VAAAISDYGFPAEVVDASGLAFRVLGMVCASCPPRIEMAIGRLRGVAKVEANLLLGKVVVRYNAAVVGARTIKRAIEALEYDATLWEDGDDQGLSSTGSRFGSVTGHAREAMKYRREFFLSAAFAFPLFFLMMVLDKIDVVHKFMMTDVLNGAATPGALPFDVRRERRAGDARAVLARRTVLRKSVARGEARRRQHGPARRDGHLRRVRVLDVRRRRRRRRARP
jgi:copper chaperone CopZ